MSISGTKIVNNGSLCPLGNILWGRFINDGSGGLKNRAKIISFILRPPIESVNPPYIRDMKFCDPSHLTLHSDNHNDRRTETRGHHSYPRFRYVHARYNLFCHIVQIESVLSILCPGCMYFATQCSQNQLNSTHFDILQQKPTFYSI